MPPQEAVDPARPPPRVDDLLPPLPDYVTDDQAEAGELRSSLDHGSVPYVDVRRRLVLDERGFASAEISVVTLEPVRGAAEHLIDHRFGDAPRSEIRIGGEEVLRIETVPFATLVSIGPGFVMTFQRGQGRSDEWLEQLVEATLHAVALGTRRAGNTAQEWCDLSGIAACRYPVEPAAA